MTYKARVIKFKELISINDWKIKVYTISKNKNFNQPIFYKNVLEKLPEWLLMENSFNATNDKIGFLILHEGTEGLFSLINWWVGKNMLNTHIFLTDLKHLNKFKTLSGDGLAPCIWELEIINHERLSWIANVLKMDKNPDYIKYIADTLDCEM
ncbi:MAG: hypothetical protein AAGH46_04930 [Bacteroidota bacterium]